MNGVPNTIGVRAGKRAVRKAKTVLRRAEAYLQEQLKRMYAKHSLDVPPLQPTVDGYYWARCGDTIGVVEVQLDCDANGAEHVYQVGNEVPMSFTDFEWLSGPLEVPK